MAHDKKIFNGFEAWFIETALLEAIENAEKQVLEAEKNESKRLGLCLYSGFQQGIIV